ncbi:hypothetical protein [Ectothiorhodospira shaposhnikovii]|uniref:hypothetical protein n=1 Tax=Ectothiorhodospira shaposhnikovii TaxID=1054 RepID=UPI001EE81D20|nr:hypothetical protein [Ectothiorhodospira shaposhnikovii]MCG5512833.1 hypothetical protein [Ectothiorhodospira shaposhnikovii]
MSDYLMKIEVKWENIDKESFVEEFEVETPEELAKVERDLVDKGAVTLCVTPLDGPMTDEWMGVAE